MATTTNGADWKSAPQTFDAFYRQYHPYVMHMCAKYGIDENNREDVTSEIMLRCFKYDVLGKFEPDRVFEYHGEQRVARFKTFIGRYIELKLRGQRDKQNTLKQRETLICDVVMSEDESGNKSTWAELFGGEHADHADIVIEAVTNDQEAAAVRQRLAEIPPRTENDRCDLVKLFDALRVQVLAYGDYNVKDLQPHFGVSNTTVSQWLWWLKANLANIYGRPVPSKRARTIGRKS